MKNYGNFYRIPYKLPVGNVPDPISQPIETYRYAFYKSTYRNP